MITLEEHLNRFKNIKEKNLAAAWTLNKTKLSSVLSLITTAFPTYSLHDASHSDTIIENIERLLGNNIKKLGATDAFMLLMAAYTHDLGMYLSYKTIEEKWKENEFAQKINELENHHDYQIAQAARFLRETRNMLNKPTSDKTDTDAKTDENDKDSILWALEIKNAVTLLTIELFRDEHAIRSRKYLNDYSEFEKLLENIQQYGGMKATLADIAYLHYENFDKIFILDKEANGYTGSGDVFHPRFVACMLRLGDLLDFDNNRFNKFAMAMVKEVPETSLAHYRKHLSTRNETSNISPTEIKATFNCEEDSDFRVTAKWIKMVEQEIKNMHSYWSEISPKGPSGMALFQLPSAKQINIQLKFRGEENPNPDLMNLRFDISSKKTFEMLKGGAIYEKPGRVFLREIVQNAMDATKLQLWHDLKNGYYLPLHLNNPKRDIITIEGIKFSDDIPAEIYDNYPIKLSVEYLEKEEIVRVICEDWGTGISEESLIRLTSKVGESRKADKDYEKTIKEMPYFLQPTAAFGLGLQTIFFVADEFRVETCCPDNKSRCIIFRTATNGSFCSIENKKITMHRGTKVIIDIGKDHWGNLFELGGEAILSEHQESVEHYIPVKIDDYITDIFHRTESIPFFYKSPFIEFQSSRANMEFIHFEDEKDFRVSYIFKNDQDILFRIEEIKHGSIIEIFYDNVFIVSHMSSKLLLRDLEIDHYRDFDDGGCFRKLKANIRWNLFCREADKIVSISRNELLPQGEVWCIKTLKSLMPDIIRLTDRAFRIILENNYDIKIKSDYYFKIQYFSLCLIDWSLSKQIIKDFDPIKELELPASYAFKKGAPVFAEELLTANKIVFIDSHKIHGDGYHTLMKIEPDNNFGIICNTELFDYIPENFICNKLKLVKLCYFDNYGKAVWEWEWCSFLQKFSDFGPQTVEFTNEDTSHVFIQYNHYHQLVPGFNRYITIVVNDAPMLGYSQSFHCNCWIYPVIYDSHSGWILETESRDKLKQKLETGEIQKLVPDYIVKLIQKHNILKNTHLTKEEIYKSYIDFILDNRFGICEE